MLAALILSCTIPGVTQDLRFRASPELSIPLTDQNIFGLGGGGSLDVDLTLFNFLAPYAGMDVRYVAPPTSEMDTSLVLTSAGGGLGLYAFPFPRLKLAVSGGSGVYMGSYSSGEDTIMTGNVFWEAGGEIGFRIRPGFTLSAGASYTDYLTEHDSFYRGLSVSLIADIGLRTRDFEGRAVLDGVESRTIYPVLAQEYAGAPLGTATIRNAESAEMRNIQVWFEAEGYTSGPALCGSVAYLGRGASTTVPLLANFSDQVMEITESVRLNAEIRVTYEILGEARASRSEMTIQIADRNAFTWQDPAVLASFISPNDPAVLDTSKFLAGVVRSESLVEVDPNLQYALGIFEGLRLSGITWKSDPQTPYQAMRSSASEVDYVQYPHQTIAYRSGDSDDLAVLYASALEAVGVPAAVIPLEDEVIAVFRMSSNEEETKNWFINAEEFMFIEGEAWVPIRISMLREGFLQAWRQGAEVVNRTPQAGELFYPLAEAWQEYPPASVPGIAATTEKPAVDQVKTAFGSVISLVVLKEVQPRVESIRSSFGPDGGNARQRNFLGVLYARYGMYEEALSEFEAAADLGDPRAIVNIGNIAFLLEDFEGAVASYQQALDRNPRQVAAIIGLARAYYELDLYEEADRYFQLAREMRPEVADRYSYLSARLPGGTARASSAMDRLGDMMWSD
ncbi:MAG: tetratricopeptide repeat protein [bacterium]